MKKILLPGLIIFLLTALPAMANEELAGRFERLYEAMLETGLEALNQEYYVEAEKIFQRIIRVADDPVDTRPHIYLGICQIRMQQLEEGIKSLKIAILRNTKFRDMVDFHLGLAYAQKGDPKAIIHLNGYIQTKPDDPAGYEAIGKFILDNPKLSHAVENGCGYLRTACLLGRCQALDLHKSQNRCMQ